MFVLPMYFDVGWTNRDAALMVSETGQSTHYNIFSFFHVGSSPDAGFRWELIRLLTGSAVTLCKPCGFHAWGGWQKRGLWTRQTGPAWIHQRGRNCLDSNTPSPTRQAWNPEQVAPGRHAFNSGKCVPLEKIESTADNTRGQGICIGRDRNRYRLPDWAFP